MVRVEGHWQDNVKVFTDDGPIRWKARQPKDRKKICSENSEDALTWQVFRTLHAIGQLNVWVTDALGIVDKFVPYFWQRRFDNSDIDPDIKAAISEVEPYHVKHNLQHTETDLTLRGDRHLVMCEMKLGAKHRQITGWQQGQNSPIVNDYRPHAILFVAEPNKWEGQN